mmetsp:Transcript_77852/g.218165  ORF Transcript_77852/g.218165 Transcript_77852/m.218165 type:complete len:264 (-) Transcript_77852:326-1117(-)
MGRHGPYRWAANRHPRAPFHVPRIRRHPIRSDLHLCHLSSAAEAEAGEGRHARRRGGGRGRGFVTRVVLLRSLVVFRQPHPVWRLDVVDRGILVRLVARGFSGHDELVIGCGHARDVRLRGPRLQVHRAPLARRGQHDLGPLPLPGHAHRKALVVHAPSQQPARACAPCGAVARHLLRRDVGGHRGVREADRASWGHGAVSVARQRFVLLRLQRPRLRVVGLDGGAAALGVQRQLLLGRGVPGGLGRRLAHGRLPQQTAAAEP